MWNIFINKTHNRDTLQLSQKKYIKPQSSDGGWPIIFKKYILICFKSFMKKAFSYYNVNDQQIYSHMWQTGAYKIAVCLANIFGQFNI